MALPSTALGGLGFGAAGTVGDEGERDYHHGVIPSVLLGPRLILGERAIGLHYLISTRDARFPDLRDRHQSVETVSLSYNVLGHTRFGAVEWPPGAGSNR